MAGKRISVIGAGGTPADTDLIVTVQGTGTKVTRTQTLATLSEGLNYTPNFTGALRRPSVQKLREAVSLLEAVPNAEREALRRGETTYDVWADAQGLFEDCVAKTRGANIPSGVYYTSKGFEINGHIPIRGEGLPGYQEQIDGETNVLPFSGMGLAGTWFVLQNGAALTNGWTDPEQHAIFRVVFNPSVDKRRRWTSFRGIGVHGNGHNQDASTLYSLIASYGCFHLDVQECTLYSPRGDGISAGGTGGNNADLRAFRNWIVGGSYARYGIYNESSDFQIGWNTIALFIENGIRNLAGAGQINDNSVWYNGHGIFCTASAARLGINNNALYDNKRTGLYLSGTSTTGSRVVTVQGNWVLDNGTDDTQAQADRVGIRVVGAGIWGLNIGGNVFGNTKAEQTQQVGLKADGPTGQMWLGTNSFSALPDTGQVLYPHPIANVQIPSTYTVNFHTETGSCMPQHPSFTLAGGQIVGAGHFIAGATASYTASSNRTPLIQSHSDNSGVTTAGFYQWGSSPIVELLSSRGALGAHTALTNGQTIGTITFSGSNGTAFTARAQVSATAQDVAGNLSGRLRFLTLDTSDPTPANWATVERGGINGTGQWTWGASQTVFLHANGIPVVPTFTVATLPSASTYSGGMIRVSDGTSNKRFAVSDGTNWRWPDGAIVS